MLNRDSPQPTWDAAKFKWQYFQASLSGNSIRRQVPSADDHGHKRLRGVKHTGAPAAVNVAQASRRLLAEARNIRVWLHAHVRNVTYDRDGARSRESQSSAPMVVSLGCGHVPSCSPPEASTTRASCCCRIRARAVSSGNAHDQVGRYLMDHHYAAIGAVAGEARTLRARFRQLWFDKHGQRHVYVTGASLTAQRQREERLARGTVYLFEHMRAPAPVSSLRRGAPCRAPRTPSSAEIAEDCRQRWAYAVRLVEGLYGSVVAKRHAFCTLTSKVDVGCNVEQVPDAESRVTLSDRTGCIRSAAGTHRLENARSRAAHIRRLCPAL